MRRKKQWLLNDDDDNQESYVGKIPVMFEPSHFAVCSPIVKVSDMTTNMAVCTCELGLTHFFCLYKLSQKTTWVFTVFNRPTGTDNLSMFKGLQTSRRSILTIIFVVKVMQFMFSGSFLAHSAGTKEARNTLEWVLFFQKGKDAGSWLERFPWLIPATYLLCSP